MPKNRRSALVRARDCEAAEGEEGSGNVGGGDVLGGGACAGRVWRRRACPRRRRAFFTARDDRGRALRCGVVRWLAKPSVLQRDVWQRRLADTHGIHTMASVPTRCGGSGSSAQATTTRYPSPDSRRWVRHRSGMGMPARSRRVGMTSMWEAWWWRTVPAGRFLG